jgi:hypothetical protein
MDTQTIIIVVAIVLLIAYLLYRNQSSTNNDLRQGTERPSFDNPNIQGHGGFGRDRGNQRNASNSEATQPSSHNDDPNVRGKGSFGRDKS